jgi:hypothetical protein
LALPTDSHAHAKAPYQPQSIAMNYNEIIIVVRQLGVVRREVHNASKAPPRCEQQGNFGLQQDHMPTHVPKQHCVAAILCHLDPKGGT